MNPGTSACGAQTAAAVCTAPGKAGIAVVRISGPEAFRIADALCPGAARVPAGAFRYRRLRDPFTGGALGEAVLLSFRAPRSYTGEDVVEIQTHGGAMAAARVLRAALSAGAASAGPGEFTKRAFLNGRLDLSAAEAVMDLIGAESERAARMADEQLSGALGRRVNALQDSLLAVCADVEASLDFADDEAGRMLEPARVPERIAETLAAVRALSATWREGRLLRDGALVVISGAPNAGKSTLFNALLGAGRAIVTDIPGTTRDSIEETLVIRGIPVRLADTAGLRETDSVVERLGVARAEELAAKADLNIRAAACGAGGGAPRAWQGADGATRAADGKTLWVFTKSDLCAPPPDAPEGALAVSALAGTGVEELKNAIAARLQGGADGAADGAVAVSERHHALLDEAAAALEEAMRAHRRGAEEAAVICAQRLRAAAEALGRVTGRAYSEELLGLVFSRFCVGK